MEEFKDIQNELITKLADGLSKKLDDLLVEGLARKGHVFDSKKDLEDFIRQYCTCEHRPHLEEKTYLVNGEPFLLHVYGIQINPITQPEGTTTIKASGGYYQFL